MAPKLDFKHGIIAYKSRQPVYDESENTFNLRKYLNSEEIEEEPISQQKITKCSACNTREKTVPLFMDNLLKKPCLLLRFVL